MKELVKTEEATEEQISMIEEFQCPGCTCGTGVVDCDRYDFCNFKTGCWCVGHSAGTMMAIPCYGFIKIALGMPKGFNRVGTIKTGFEKEDDRNTRRSTNIRLIIDHSSNSERYDKFNVPVWAMEKDGYLFVRVISPRINYTYVDVIKGGKMADICPQAIDVSEFWEDLD